MTGKTRSGCSNNSSPSDSGIVWTQFPVLSGFRDTIVLSVRRGPSLSSCRRKTHGESLPTLGARHLFSTRTHEQFVLFTPNLQTLRNTSSAWHGLLQHLCCPCSTRVLSRLLNPCNCLSIPSRPAAEEPTLALMARA